MSWKRSRRPTVDPERELAYLLSPESEAADDMLRLEREYPISMQDAMFSLVSTEPVELQIEWVR